MRTALETLFDAVSATKNPHARGILFQEFLRHLLVESRFEVHANPRIAKPRQSDLFANRDDLDFLIEAKWLTKKIDVSDIDDLRVRLNRVPGNFIGCLFSMSEYTTSAILEVERDRQREILLIRPDEIKSLLSFGRSVFDLIQRKRKVFRIDGKVWFSGQKQRLINPETFPLPKVERLLNIKSLNSQSFENRSDNHEIIFFSQIPERSQFGQAVRIELTPHVDSISDLKNFVAVLHNHLTLSSEGSFTITQSGYHWHGFGIDNFFREIQKWRDRYAHARLHRIHHSEDLHYFTEFRSGFILLTLRQSVGENRNSYLYSCQLEIRLPGIPIDTRPFLKICEEVRETEPFFTVLSGDELERCRFKKGIYIEPVGKILSTKFQEEQSVCGLVVKNPFYKQKVMPPEITEKYSVLPYIASIEHLICNMSDWHDVDDVIDKYRLTRLEGISIGPAIIMHPVCTWDNIIKRPSSKSRIKNVN